MASFVAWLRESDGNKSPDIDITEDQTARKPRSINTILGCISSFYRFHNQLGNTDIAVTESKNLPNNRYKALLYHVFKNKPAQKRIISVRQTIEPPKTINEDQFAQLNNACTNYRDRFLICLLWGVTSIGTKRYSKLN